MLDSTGPLTSLSLPFRLLRDIPDRTSYLDTSTIVRSTTISFYITQKGKEQFVLGEHNFEDAVK